MSRPTIVTFEPGESARDATQIASSFTSFVTASGDVDDEVVAEEGIDERSVVDKFASEMLLRQANSGGPTVNSNTAFATANIGGNLRTGSFVVPAGYKLKVVATLTCITTAGQVGIDSGRYVSGRIAKSIAAVITPIVNTTRYLGEDQGPSSGQGGDITTGIVLGPASYDWIEVQTTLDAAGNYQMDNGTIFGELYYTG